MAILLHSSKKINVTIKLMKLIKIKGGPRKGGLSQLQGAKFKGYLKKKILEKEGKELIQLKLDKYQQEGKCVIQT